MYDRFMMRKWLTLAIAALFITAIVLAGCPGDPNGDGNGDTLSFSITGSNTVQPLSVVWAEAFMDQRSEVSIAVSGPGSGVGIAALIDGTTEVAQSSRLIRQSEIDQAQARGVNPYEITVAQDALAVVVHPSNPVTELTIAQLSAIYSGQITNWQELGGEDLPIVVLSRDTNSGTHVFFKETVVQMRGLATEETSLEYGPNVLFLPSTSAGIEETAGNTRAIFYPGLAYVTADVQALAIKRTADDPAVLPSVETAQDGTYPVVRPLLYYTNGAPAGVIKDFIDYCLSPAGQARVVDVGYVPVQ
ncbi:MAG: phosphate ABC transporter substrate-binding protein [Dehalococcoidia bacterium]|nr:phosphate ABC transporter substrate-binding protein [Dehalococcoidia bacterium]